MTRRLLLAVAVSVLAGCTTLDDPVAPPTPSPTTVSLVDAQVTPGFARITWQVADGNRASYQIYRRLNTKPWKHMFTRFTDAEQRLVLEDPSVQPGQTYTYRVLVETPTANYQGEVTIVVPL